MSGAVVADWSQELRAAFRRAPIRFEHRLAETGLFDDEGLIRLLDTHPADHFDINMFDFDDKGGHVLRTGERGKLDGAAALAAVKEGRIWIQLRSVHEHSPAIAAAIQQAYADISAQIPGFRPVQITGQLILSAPGAKVPFHADSAFVVLWHLRGRKRIYVYPADEAHMPQAAMEKINMRQQTEDLPYDPEMDAEAQAFDLAPGQALTWPLHAPHRVENLEGFNVSLSTDFQTWGSRLINGTHFTQGVMRGMGLPVAPVDRLPRYARAGLWACSTVLRRSGVVRNEIKRFKRSFELGDELHQRPDQA